MEQSVWYEIISEDSGWGVVRRHGDGTYPLDWFPYKVDAVRFAEDSRARYYPQARILVEHIT